MSPKLYPWDLVPLHWGVSGIRSSADIEFLGRLNLLYLARHWRSQERAIEASLKGSGKSTEQGVGAGRMHARSLLAQYQECIRIVFRHKARSVEKPLFPRLRTTGDFFYGESVAVHARAIPNVHGNLNVWHWGQISGNFDRDHVVVNFTRGVRRGRTHLDRATLNVDTQIPHLVDVRDFQYLREHPDYAYVWFTSGNTGSAIQRILLEDFLATESDAPPWEWENV